MADPVPRVPAPRAVRGEDLLEIRTPMEVAVGAVVDQVAVVVAQYDAVVDRLTHRLHLLGRNGRLEPIASTSSPDVEQRAPRWSADATRLAWLDGTGDERQVAVLDLVRTHQGGAPQVVGTEAWRSRMQHRVSVHDLAPDGHLLLVGIDVEDAHGGGDPVHRSASTPVQGGRHELWQVPVGAESPRRCWTGDAPITAIAWDTSGQRFAFVVTRRPSIDGPVSSSLWLGEIDRDPEAAVIVDHGPIHAIAWAPDARRLAFLGTEIPGDGVGERRLWVLDGGVRRIAADLDRSIGQVVRGDDERGIGPPSMCWTPDGSAILVPVADGGRSVLMRLDVDGASSSDPWDRGAATGSTVVAQVVADASSVTGGDGCILEFALAGDGGIVVSWSSPHEPGELSVLTDGGLDRLTALNDGWRRAVVLAPTVDVRATVADHEVEGWLTLPPAFASSAPAALPPIIVELHGGPHYPIGRRFSFNAQRWAGQGFAVLRLNPRGSQGYGAAFAHAIERDWGGGDLADVLGVLDAAIGELPLDATRVAISGESYGGFLSAWALASTDRFVAGVAENGVSDLVAATLRDPNPVTWSALGAPPWQLAELGHDRSPVRHAAGIRAPMLLIRAVDDLVVEPYQVLALWHTLVALGSDVELLELPGEGHFINVTGRPSSRLFRSRVVDDWFARQFRMG